MTAETKLGLPGKGGSVVHSALAFLFMASCVSAPQTYSSAGDMRFRDGARHHFPQCSSVYGDVFAMSFVKPVIDVGNGMAATVSEGFAELDSGRNAAVFDCETGVGFSFEEPLIGSDAEAGAVQTLSEDPSFRSPLEKLLLGLSSSGSNGSIRKISDHAVSEGFSPAPLILWEPGSTKYRLNEDQACACELYYPSIERHWFDNRKVGPSYPETLGSYPKTLSELEARMIALRARK